MAVEFFEQRVNKLRLRGRTGRVYVHGLLAGYLWDWKAGINSAEVDFVIHCNKHHFFSYWWKQDAVYRIELDLGDGIFPAEASISENSGFDEICDTELYIRARRPART